ncbi:MAG TPA: hypothetical protein VGP73_26630 [Thermoanaerobaculia bacterium]
MKRKLAVAVLLVVLAILGVAAVSADNAGKVDVCHIPPGNPDNAHIINVSWNSVPAHLAHGDQLYTCDSGGPK